MIFRFLPFTGHILCIGKIEANGVFYDVSLLFDTACSRTTFRTSYLQDVGALKANVSPVSVATGSGTAPADTYVLQDFMALGYSTGPTTVLGMNFPADIEHEGILGMDFLSKLKMTIDFPMGTIRILKPTKRTAKGK